MGFGSAIRHRTQAVRPAVGAGLLLLSLSLPVLGDEAPKTFVRVIECDGEQYVQIITDPGEAFPLEDPCSLIGRAPPPPPAWICVGGRCFPRTFILAPPFTPARPGRPAPQAPATKRPH